MKSLRNFWSQVFRSVLGWAFIWLAVVLALSPAFGQTPPANDNFTNRIALMGESVSTTGNNEFATRQSGEPDHGVPGSRSVWWTWTATSNDVVTVDTIGSSFDTALAVYTGISVSTFLSIAKNDDGGFNGTSLLSFAAIAGTANQIVVQGYGTAYGNIVLNVRQGPVAPQITNQPQSRAVQPGSGVSFSVAAIGTPLNYQWRKERVDIPSATNASYTISNAQTNHVGNYEVIVTNSAGSVTSKVAVLTVNDVVITTHPKSSIAAVGYDVSFSAVAIGTNPRRFQWLKDGSEIISVTNTSYSITNVQSDDIGTYTVTVTNEIGGAVSSNAILSVISPYTFVTIAGAPGKSGTNDGKGADARFDYPTGIVLDSAGNLFVSDWWAHTIRKISPSGIVSTFAGTPRSLGTNDGPGSSARFSSPEGIAIDGSDNLYVADNFNHTIRKIAPDGMVSTFAGRPGVTGATDGPGATATFQQPSSLAVDSSGQVFVAEWGNSLVRRIKPDGTVSRFHLFKASVPAPIGIAVDSEGVLYVGSSQLFFIEKITTNGIVSVHGVGFNQPFGVAVDSGRNLFVTDRSQTVKRITPDGIITTLAGLSGNSGTADGAGTSTRFNANRNHLVVDSAGNIFLSDNLNYVVRKGVPFAVTTLPQSQAVPSGTSVDLTVAASGPSSFSFQWFFGETPLAGQTNTALQIGPMRRTNSGVYSVVVSNATGNFVKLSATVRALFTPILQPPEFPSGDQVRLQLQDADGGLPYDITKLELQWRTNLPSGADTNWLIVTNGFYLTNGFVAIDQTNSATEPTRFYRVVER